MKKIFLKTFCILLTPFLTHAKLWDLNDVTYLFPLPEKIENSLLRVTDTGTSGELLPAAVLSKLPFLIPGFTNDYIFKNLRVVALRIDPCFPLPNPSSCQKQVRLVWQPLDIDESGAITTLDTALHSFYVLSDSQFNLLLSQIQIWKNKNSTPQNQSSALDVYPLWKKEKDKTASLVEFQNLIKNFIGSANLSRITMMVLRRAGDVWGFLGFDISQQLTMQRMTIARLANEQTQFFTNALNVDNNFIYAQMAPPPIEPYANLQNLVSKPKYLTEEDILLNLKSTFDIENPNVFTPENMDCVSCHIAQPAREWIKKKLPLQTYKESQIQHESKNTNYNLENKSTQVFNTQQFRALGYFKNQISISQRVINESATVAEALNSQSSNKKNRSK